jgi:hypothetical protein
VISSSHAWELLPKQHQVHAWQSSWHSWAICCCGCLLAQASPLWLKDLGAMQPPTTSCLPQSKKLLGRFRRNEEPKVEHLCPSFLYHQYRTQASAFLLPNIICIWRTP